MKVRWSRWHFGLVCIVIVVGMMMFLPSGGVREIHNSDLVSNFALVDPRPRRDDWPWLRGTDQSNVVVSDQFRVRWSADENDGWQAPMPGGGKGSPILWDDQLILLTSDPTSHGVEMRSHHRRTGRPIWKTELHSGVASKGREKKPPLSSTPACDGQFVFAATTANSTLWVTSVDMTGRIAWQHEAGPYNSKSEYAASPTLFKSLVIVAADQEKDSFLTAFHRQTGGIIWRVKRPNGESFGTAIVATISGKPQLVIAGKGTVASYDPATGDSLWTYRWTAERVGNTVAFDENHVFATTRQPDSEIVCIKADGAGDVTKTHLAWRQTKIGSDVLSPVIHEGLLYVLQEDGQLACFEAATGKPEWRTRLAGRFTVSPVLTGEYLVCSNEAGVTSVVETRASGDVVAENILPGGITTSPIVVGEAIFIRTSNSLQRIQIPNSESIAEQPEPSQRRL